MSTRKRALFIDRDGTLVKEPPVDYQFNLKQIGIGNEQWGPMYPERLQKFMEQIHSFQRFFHAFKKHFYNNS